MPCKRKYRMSVFCYAPISYAHVLILPKLNLLMEVGRPTVSGLIALHQAVVEIKKGQEPAQILSLLMVGKHVMDLTMNHEIATRMYAQVHLLGVQ